MGSILFNDSAKCCRKAFVYDVKGNIGNMACSTSIDGVEMKTSVRKYLENYQNKSNANVAK